MRATGTPSTARPAAKAAPGLQHAVVRPALERSVLERAFADPVQSVSTSVRAQVAAAAGTPLDDVRVHTGPRVRTAARAAGAAAFTIGRDIGVATGPGQAIPDALLAHELIHAAQQAGHGTASPGEAEAQAHQGAHDLGALGPLASAGAGSVAFAAEDWLQATPDIRHYGYTELLDELRAVTEWLDRQTASTPKRDRMAEAKAAIEAEIARRKGAVSAAERPPPRRRGRGKAPEAQPELPEQTEMPRVLREHASFQLTDPAEIRAEVDRIIAWLQRPDLTRSDRSILHQELALLEPGVGAALNKESAQRQQKRLAQAFSPAAGADRGAVLGNIRLIESIRPYSAQPGMAYVVHNGELLVFPQEVADRVRAEVTAALEQAARRAQSMNESTKYRMREHMRLNYEDQYIVGFFVSLVSGEEPVEVQTRMLGPMSESNIALGRYRTAQKRGSLTEMADAVFTAVEKADRAQTIVLEGIDRALAAAGQIVQGLTITRDLSFAIALSIGAILAAPVVAAGVTGLGATGLTATGLTAIGTGAAVGGEGMVLGGLGGAGGELAAGHGGRAALRAGWSEAKRVGAQGAAIGVGGGASFGLARNLGVGAAGLSRGSQLWRAAAAGGGGNVFGGVTGALLSDVPEGQSRAGYVLRSGAWSGALGVFGGAAGAGSQWIGSQAELGSRVARFGFGAARFGVGVGLPSVAGAGATYLQTGDWRQSLQAGALNLTLGGLASRQPAGVTPMQRRAFQFGRQMRSTALAYTGAAMIGLARVGPSLRMGESPAAVSITATTEGGPVTGAQPEQAPVQQQAASAAQAAQPEQAPVQQAAPAAQAAQPEQAPVQQQAPAQQPWWQQATPAGEEVFAQLTTELSLQAAQTHTGGAASAASEAVSSGLIGAQGAPGAVDVAVQAHSAASEVRGEYGVSGANVQSAHIGPTSFLRDLPGYSRGRAQTTLLDRNVHAALDSHWKAWAIRQRQAGRTDVSVQEMYNVMLEAIDRTPGMTQQVKNALSWRLQTELFQELGLQPTARIPLPYRNIPPQ